MIDKIKFYMVPVSPWSFLSMKRLKNLSKKYKVPIDIKPIDLFQIFKENGIKLVSERSACIQKNRINELKRWGSILNIKLNVKPKHFPVNPEKTCKILIASTLTNEKNKTFDLAYSISKALWTQNKNINSDITLIKLIKELKFKNDILKLAKQEKTLINYIKNTKEAIKNNVFGVPTFIYKKKLFWGQDRMSFLENHIKIDLND